MNLILETERIFLKKFTKNDFNQPGDNYTWNVSLINVGPPISIIIFYM